MEIRKELQKLAATTCANYNPGDGMCLPADKPCVFEEPSTSTHIPRCNYFNNAVLPGEPSLEARYWSAFGDADPNAVSCGHCGELFIRKSNAKYCDDCRPIIQREQRRKRDAEYRERKRLNGRK